MGESQHDIDEIFRQRFDGLKNYNVDPSIGWATVEAGLNATASSAGVAASTGIVWSKAAAIIGASLIVAGAFQSDQMVTKNTSGYQIEIAHPEFVKSSFDVQPPTIDTGDKQSSTSSTPQSINESVAFISESKEVELESPAVDVDRSEEINKEFAFQKTGERLSDRINIMKPLTFGYDQPEVIDRDFEDPVIASWKSNHMWYLRGSVRVGSGESNSFEVESQWKANPAFAFGYGYSLTDQSFITVEVGWLRRSGNGIERTRDINLDPIISSITGNNSSEGGYLIHESLVATRMDYVHVPVSFNQMFNDRWSVSVGGFLDYLISARNDGYIVFDNTQYRSAVSGRKELHSKDGLNKYRYGALLGAERTITSHLSAFGNMMVPLNSAVDANSDYRVIDQSNRLIDLQLGLVYRI